VPPSLSLIAPFARGPESISAPDARPLPAGTWMSTKSRPIGLWRPGRTHAGRASLGSYSGFLASAVAVRTPMTAAEIAQLQAQVPLYEVYWLLGADIPVQHYQAFWTFTGAQTMTRCPDGKSRLPLSAWSELRRVAE
jgi:hypothetical protein